MLDPVSAPMPASAKGDLTDLANCNRTLPIFDGAARFDVVLSYGETRRSRSPAKGPVLVCNARYVPIAGHRALRPTTKFMQDNRDMSVAGAGGRRPPAGAAAHRRPDHGRHERDRGVAVGRTATPVIPTAGEAAKASAAH